MSHRGSLSENLGIGEWRVSKTHQRTRDISQDFEGSHYRLGKGCQFLGGGVFGQRVKEFRSNIVKQNLV